MIVDCAHYRDGHRADEGKVPLAEIADRRAQGGFVWLGLFEPGEEELTQVRETFGLHELAIEDALILHRHPKLASYDPDVQLVIVRTARYDDDEEEVDFGEISVFVAPTFVITVRQGVATDLTGVRQRLEERPELLAVITTVERTAPKKLRPYLRDVHDHLFRADEGIADQRELLRQMLEANMAVISVEQTRVSVQQNRTIQQLTILATIVLPLTFITGFFGQNFGWLVDHIKGFPAFLVYGIGGLVVPLVLLITWMRLRMPHVDTRAAVGQAAGAGHH
jgi:Mg2+ and Co2+ transporter CorA